MPPKFDPSEVLEVRLAAFNNSDAQKKREL